MSLVIYKFLASLLIFLTSLVAVAYPVKVRAQPSHHRLLELGDAFASGIFLGAALFHMLPDAIQDFSQALGNVHYPLAELLCAGGFLLLLFFERLSGNSSNNHYSILSSVVVIIIIIHSFIEGTVLGINSTVATTAIIFLAIIVHKSSEGFMLAVTLMRSKIALKNIIILIAIFSCMTPAGIAFGTSLTMLLQAQTGLLLTAGFNAFAAGTFLYMSTLHHINHHQRSHHGEGLIEFVALVAGLSVMAGLAIQI